VPKERIGCAEETFPLEVNFCQDCAHLQLSHVINPEVWLERIKLFTAIHFAMLP
jgi:ribosomal protein L32